MRSIALLLVLTESIYGQVRPTGPATTTNSVCSQANTGNNNTFNITCGIGKQQGEQMLKILNQVLANQLDPDAVMAKLDEILRNMPHIRDFNEKGFTESLKGYKGHRQRILIQADRLTPFAMKLTKALGIEAPDLIDNGTYTNALTIQYMRQNGPGDDSEMAAKFLQSVLDTFHIQATIEPADLGSPNTIRIKISSQF